MSHLVMTYVVAEEAMADQFSGVSSHHRSGGRGVVGSFRFVNKGWSGGVSSAVCDENHGACNTAFAVERSRRSVFSRLNHE